MSRMTPRRTFGPSVLLGLASTGLFAWVSTKPWAEPVGASAQTRSTLEMIYSTAGQVPAAAAVGLVALACWGVLLVTRGLVRRIFAGAGALCVLGLVAIVATGAGAAREDVRRGLASVSTSDQAGLTPWYWVAAALLVPMLLAFLAACRWAGAWPAMGERYERPDGTGDSQRALAEAEDDPLGLWRALDRGDDPTG